MDSIFGIGIPELILILVIAGLILGPKQIQSIARNLGRFTGMIRGMSGDIRNIARALSTELDAIEDVKAAKQDLALLQANLAALQRDVDAARREFLKPAVDAEQRDVAATRNALLLSGIDLQKADLQKAGQPKDGSQPEQASSAMPMEADNSIAPPYMLENQPVEPVSSMADVDGSNGNSAEITLPNPIPVPDDEE